MKRCSLGPDRSWYDLDSVVERAKIPQTNLAIGIVRLDDDGASVGILRQQKDARRADIASPVDEESDRLLRVETIVFATPKDLPDNEPIARISAEIEAVHIPRYPDANELGRHFRQPVTLKDPPEPMFDVRAEQPIARDRSKTSQIPWEFSDNLKKMAKGGRQGAGGTKLAKRGPINNRHMGVVYRPLPTPSQHYEIDMFARHATFRHSEAKEISDDSNLQPIADASSEERRWIRTPISRSAARSPRRK